MNTEIKFVSSANIPKESHSRNRRLRKKLHMGEYAHHFIDIRFDLEKQLTDTQLVVLDSNPNVTFWTMTSGQLTVSLEADTGLIEFTLALMGRKGLPYVNKHIIERVGYTANTLSSIANQNFAQQVSSIHFGDAVYAEDDYYETDKYF